MHKLATTRWECQHLPSKRVFVSETEFVLENSFVKSRPHMAALADPSEAKCYVIVNGTLWRDSPEQFNVF